MTERKKIDRIVEIITSIVATDKIYVIGCEDTEILHYSIFSDDPVSSKFASRYYLLIVRKGTEAKLDYIIDAIETKCRPIASVSFIIIETSSFLEMAKEGHPFLRTVLRANTEAYSSKDDALQVSETDDEKWKASIKADVTTWMANAASLMASAQLLILRKEYNTAAFFLHQVAEQSLMAIFQVHTGYRMNSHNLEKIYRFCCLFCESLTKAFPRTTDKEKSFFSLFQRAYIDARYKSNFTVKETDIKYFLENSETVLSTAKEAAARL